jgi:hypothetical protein
MQHTWLLLSKLLPTLGLLRSSTSTVLLLLLCTLRRQQQQLLPAHLLRLLLPLSVHLSLP